MARYTDERMQMDMKRDLAFFQELLNRELGSIREKMDLGAQFARQEARTGYNLCMEVSRRAGRDPGKLQEALDAVRQSLADLDEAADSEIAGIRQALLQRLGPCDDVR